jgi:hypothetical protein
MSAEPERLFYTLDYMLASAKEWKRDMWVRHQRDPKNPWVYKCWQDLNSLEAGLMRAVEVQATVEADR